MAKAIKPLPLRAIAELELRRRRAQGHSLGALPDNLRTRAGEHPVDYLRRVLPGVLIPTGERHLAVWDWLYQMEPGRYAQPRLEIWPRGGAKSDTAEKACVYFAGSLKRRFVLYVCGTQDQADLHIQSIAGLLERAGIPRATNKYNASLNWTAQRLQTASGFGAIGVGLNVRIRGARLGQFRPDLIILDDVDTEQDTPAATAKKLKTIASAILPAGSSDSTVLFIQNKIHPNSVIAQIADGRAEVLLGASVCQEPAVVGLQYERRILPDGVRYVITGGEPTWAEGQGIAVCEQQINQWGLSVFLTESQHEDMPDGGLWRRERDIDPFRVAVAPPQLRRIVIGIDPSGSTGTEAGIVVCALGYDGHGYVLADGSLAGTTNQWVTTAISLYHQYQADTLVVERNYGGDLVTTAIRNADNRIGIKEVVSSRGKLLRAEPIQQLYEQGRVHHVGHFPQLESEMCRWVEGSASPNRMDALVFALTELIGQYVPIEYQTVQPSEVKAPRVIRQSDMMRDDDDDGELGLDSQVYLGSFK